MDIRRLLLWAAFGLSWLPAIALTALGFDRDQSVVFQEKWMKDAMMVALVILIFYPRTLSYLLAAFAKFPRDSTIIIVVMTLGEIIVLMTVWYGIKDILAIPIEASVIIAVAIIAPTIYLWQKLFPILKPRQRHA